MPASTDGSRSAASPEPNTRAQAHMNEKYVGGMPACSVTYQPRWRRVPEAASAVSHSSYQRLCDANPQNRSPAATTTAASSTRSALWSRPSRPNRWRAPPSTATPATDAASTSSLPARP
jgi:hypothetical protein